MSEISEAISALVDRILVQERTIAGLKSEAAQEPSHYARLEAIYRPLHNMLGSEADGLTLSEVIEALRVRLGSQEARIRNLERPDHPRYDAYGSERRTQELKRMVELKEARIAELEHRFAAVQAERDVARERERELDAMFAREIPAGDWVCGQLAAALGVESGTFGLVNLVQMVRGRLATEAEER
jgi:hypothetical protein